MMCSRETQETEESNPQLFQQVHEAEDEEEEDGKFQDSGTIRRLSMLHLNSAAKRRRRRKCTACGSGGSMKRPSPPSFPQPSPKRLSRLPPSPSSVSVAAAAAASCGASGSKHPPSLLHRSLSEPIDSLGLGPLNTQTAENLCFGPFLNSASPENSKIPAKNCESRPPIHPLHRSLSDPTVALEFQPPPVAPTPPRPSVAPTPPTSVEESPNTKRLKRMKEKLRQMREWWDQVLQEEDNEHSSSFSEQHNNNSKEEEGEESVWVEEKSGEGLVIHFKCPCSKGYQIFLSGNNCYYKLM